MSFQRVAFGKFLAVGVVQAGSHVRVDTVIKLIVEGTAGVPQEGVGRLETVTLRSVGDSLLNGIILVSVQRVRVGQVWLAVI